MITPNYLLVLLVAVWLQVSSAYVYPLPPEMGIHARAESNDNSLLATEAYQAHGAFLNTVLISVPLGGIQYDCSYLVNAMVLTPAFQEAIRLPVISHRGGRMIAVSVVDVPEDHPSWPAGLNLFWAISGRPEVEATMMAEDDPVEADRVAYRERLDSNLRDILPAPWTFIRDQQIYSTCRASRPVQPEDFCLPSHPFRKYMYRGQRSAYIPSYLPDAAAPPACLCAGTKLATFLRQEGWFSSTAAQVDRDRVKCFAETKVSRYNGGHEVTSVDGLTPVDVHPIASSCTTCQVMIQVLWGQQPLPAAHCQDDEALALAKQAGIAQMAAWHANGDARAFRTYRRAPARTLQHKERAMDVTAVPPATVEIVTSQCG